jgi:hypothetical protein
MNRYRPVLAEDGVVPLRIGRGQPLRLAALVGVFDNNAEAHLAVLVLGPSQDPRTRPVHLNDHIGAHDFDKRGYRLARVAAR